MKVWDEYGRLLVKQDTTAIEVSLATWIGDNFAIYTNKLFQYNSSSGLYYEMLCNNDQGVITWYLSDTGISIP